MRKNLIYKAIVAFIRGYSSLLLRLDIHWHGNLPEGPKIFIANHPSASDPFIIHLLSDRPMGVLITANAFSFPLLGAFVRGAGQIPVVPGGGSQSLEAAKKYLESGYSVGIFPEGTFSPQGGGFQEPRTGAARLALETGAPVIPVGIYLPREKSIKIVSNLCGKQTIGYWYWRGPYGITVGQSMSFEGDPQDKEQVQATAKTMMQKIRSLAYESEQRVFRPSPLTASM